MRGGNGAGSDIKPKDGTAVKSFRTAVPLRAKTTQILSSLYPKRTCTPKRVKSLDVSYRA